MKKDYRKRALQKIAGFSDWTYGMSMRYPTMSPWGSTSIDPRTKELKSPEQMKSEGLKDIGAYGAGTALGVAAINPATYTTVLPAIGRGVATGGRSVWNANKFLWPHCIRATKNIAGPLLNIAKNPRNWMTHGKNFISALSSPKNLFDLANTGAYGYSIGEGLGRIASSQFVKDNIMPVLSGAYKAYDAYSTASEKLQDMKRTGAPGSEIANKAHEMLGDLHDKGKVYRDKIHGYIDNAEDYAEGSINSRSDKLKTDIDNYLIGMADGVPLAYQAAGNASNIARQGLDFIGEKAKTLTDDVFRRNQEKIDKVRNGVDVAAGVAEDLRNRDPEKAGLRIAAEKYSKGKQYELSDESRIPRTVRTVFSDIGPYVPGLVGYGARFANGAYHNYMNNIYPWYTSAISALADTVPFVKQMRSKLK